MEDFENQFNNDEVKETVEPIPVMNEVVYTEAIPVKDYKPQNKGLKVFALIMAGVILLTSTMLTGYLIGKNGNKPQNSGVKVDLASKPENSKAKSVSEIYNDVNKSVVGIRVYNASGKTANASGVIYSDKGYIITNDHIYSEIAAAKFKIFMHDGTERNATFVAGDTVSDLAVLKLNDASNLSVTEFGNSEEIIFGETVMAIGRPNDATDKTSITSGIVSSPSKRVKTTSNYSASLIQTDSAINPGSSGGALVNAYGQIIGITSSKLAGVEYDAVGFAIPTKTVKRIAEQLISDGRVTDRAKLGITYTEIDSVTAEIKNSSAVGLYVVTVSNDSDIFGKVKEGDIITHVNSQKITNDAIVLDVIENTKAGDTITLTVDNGKGSKDYKVTLAANYGESSYKTNISQDQDEEDKNSGGTFDFPFGE